MDIIEENPKHIIIRITWKQFEKLEKEKWLE
jgi:hypothetical protein